MSRRNRADREKNVRLNFVSLETRDVPASFYVDPSFTTPGSTVNFNVGLPNEAKGLTVGTNAFATIFDAVAKANSVAGSDDINLSTATHSVDPGFGAIMLTESANIIGSGQSFTTIEAVDNTVGPTDVDGAVFQFAPGTAVDVSELTYDGRSGLGILAGSAFRYDNATGLVSNVTIRNVATADGGINLGFGVNAVGKGANVDVVGGTFTGIGRTSVSFSDGAKGSVESSDFTGLTTPGVANYGVEALESSSVTISGSTFINFTGSDPTFDSAGVQIADDVTFDLSGNGKNADEPSTAKIVGNSFSNNGIAIVVGSDATLDTSTALIQFNNIIDNKFGVTANTKTEVNALFNFWGSATGPFAKANLTAAKDNPAGLAASEVSPLVLYRDASNKAIVVLAGPTPVVAIPSPDDYRDALTPGSIAITSPATPTSTTPVNFTVTFSEAAFGFDSDDLTVTGPGTPVISGVTSTDNKVFTVTVTGATGTGPVVLTLLTPATEELDIASVPATTVTLPTIRTGLTAGFTAVSETATVNFDDDAPTAKITSLVTVNPTNVNPVSAKITFNETVTGLSASDIILGGTATSAKILGIVPSVDGKSYQVNIGNLSGEGTVTVGLVAAAAKDAAGNANIAVASSLIATVDFVPPTLNFFSPPLVPTTTKQGPVSIAFQFSETVAFGQLAASDFVLGGTATGAKITAVNFLSNSTFGGKDTYTVVIDGFSGSSKTVTLTAVAGAVSDLAGNPSTAFGPVTVIATPPFTRGFSVSGGSGQSQPYFTVDESFTVKSGIVPFESNFTGGVRVATADVNGDGTLDVIVGSGPGRANEVRVYDGLDSSKVLLTLNPFEVTFTGGVFVAGADFDGDGKSEIIITPDQGGGPRVKVLNGKNAATGVSATFVDFFGIDDITFRGGARAGAGDTNKDGTPDLIVSAGFGGGPRIAGYDGKSLVNTPRKLFADFFAFENTLRNGAYVTVGNLNVDGFGELIVGSGPDGGPRIRAFAGVDLVNGKQTEISNFFAGDVNARGGVRVASTDIDADGIAEVLVAVGDDGTSRVKLFTASTVLAGGTPTPDREFNLFGDFMNGAFVG